jgi:hypothetical protein
MKRNQVFLTLALAAVAAAIIWRGSARNQPSSGDTEGTSLNYRGHRAEKGAATGFSLDVATTPSYPPRGLGLPPQAKPPSDSWLLDADSNWDRFRRIEVVLRGADIHMFEIGIRFGELRDAVAHSEFDLAAHQIQRIVQAAEIATLKEPGWVEGRGIEYLGRPQWQALRAAVLARDGPASRNALLAVRRTCLACHAARNMEYLNRQELFVRTASFADATDKSKP